MKCLQTRVCVPGSLDFSVLCDTEPWAGISKLIYQVNSRVADITSLCLLGQGLRFLTLLSRVPLQVQTWFLVGLFLVMIISLEIPVTSAWPWSGLPSLFSCSLLYLRSNGPIVIFSPHFGNAFGFAELTKYLPAVTGVLQIFTITCLRRKFTL